MIFEAGLREQALSGGNCNVHGGAAVHACKDMGQPGSEACRLVGVMLSAGTCKKLRCSEGLFIHSIVALNHVSNTCPC
jgi:hypothetical protein